MAVAEWEAHLEAVRHIETLRSLLDESDVVEQRYRHDRDDVDRRLTEVIRAPRRVATWQEIGDQFGVTRQAAQDRFNRHIRLSRKTDR